MSGVYPNFEDNHAHEAIFNPSDVVAYMRDRGRLEGYTPPDGIVFCYQGWLFEHVLASEGLEEPERGSSFRGLVTLPSTDHRVGGSLAVGARRQTWETLSMSEQLYGGVDNAGRVVREGDVVLRPAPENAGTIHALLGFLASRGFSSPQPLGLRDDGREVLGFIPGETSTPPYPHGWVRTGETLIGIGRMLRTLHDITRGFTAPPEAVWAISLADPQGGAVVCHNDVCIENVVVSSGKVAGLLDFDFAAPGRPVWDLAMTARYWVPLRDPASAAQTQREQLDPFARVRTLLDAYGADDETRRDFTAVLMEIEEVALRFVLERVKQGIPAFVEMWDDLGGLEWHRRKMRWLTDNRPRIDDALLT